jgi:hypothetical protein
MRRSRHARFWRVREAGEFQLQRGRLRAAPWGAVGETWRAQSPNHLAFPIENAEVGLVHRDVEASKIVHSTVSPLPIVADPSRGIVCRTCKGAARHGERRKVRYGKTCPASERKVVGSLPPNARCTQDEFGIRVNADADSFVRRHVGRKWRQCVNDRGGNPFTSFDEETPLTCSSSHRFCDAFILSRRRTSGSSGHVPSGTAGLGQFSIRCVPITGPPSELVA